MEVEKKPHQKPSHPRRLHINLKELINYSPQIHAALARLYNASYKNEALISHVKECNNEIMEISKLREVFVAHRKQLTLERNEYIRSMLEIPEPEKMKERYILSLPAELDKDTKDKIDGIKNDYKKKIDEHDEYQQLRVSNSARNYVISTFEIVLREIISHIIENANGKVTIRDLFLGDPELKPWFSFVECTHIYKCLQKHLHKDGDLETHLDKFIKFSQCILPKESYNTQIERVIKEMKEVHSKDCKIKKMCRIVCSILLRQIIYMFTVKLIKNFNEVETHTVKKKSEENSVTVITKKTVDINNVRGVVKEAVFGSSLVLQCDAEEFIAKIENKNAEKNAKEQHIVPVECDDIFEETL